MATELVPLSFRSTAEEKTSFDTAIARSGLPTASWLRETFLKAAGAPEMAAKVRAEHEALLAARGVGEPATAEATAEAPPAKRRRAAGAKR